MDWFLSLFCGSRRGASAKREKPSHPQSREEDARNLELKPPHTETVPDPLPPHTEPPTISGHSGLPLETRDLQSSRLPTHQTPSDPSEIDGFLCSLQRQIVVQEENVKLVKDGLGKLRTLYQEDKNVIEAKQTESETKYNRLLSQLEKTENLHAQNAINNSSSYGDGAASPALLATAMDAVAVAMASCAGNILRRFKGSINISNIAQLDPSSGQQSHTSLKFILQALLSQVIFRGFGDPYFSLKDLQETTFQTPSDRKRALFELFKTYRDSEVGKLIDRDINFVEYARVRGEELMERVGIRLVLFQENCSQNGQSNLSVSQSRNVVEKSFLRLAKNVWTLHKLALAFDPTAEIFRVRSNSSFHDEFMEDIGLQAACDDECSAAVHGNHKTVQFMCAPGFCVRTTLIKSKVYCLPDCQQPQNSL